MFNVIFSHVVDINSIIKERFSIKFVHFLQDTSVFNGVLKKTNLVKVMLAFASNLSFDLEYTVSERRGKNLYKREYVKC